VIKAAGADIVGLQEMIGPAPAEGQPRPIQARNLANMLGWYYVDQENNTCGIISRYKITGHTPGKWGAAIELPDGRTVHVFNVHLPSTPYQPYQLLSIPYYGGSFISTAEEAIESARLSRGNQVDAMLAEVKEHAADSDVVFIVGDFNEPSHLDWTDEAAEAGKCPLPVDWPATRAVMDVGFVDAYRAAHPSPLTHPGYTWTPTTDITDTNDRHDRIDFVFARGKGIRVTSAMVVGESKTYADVVVTPWPSDHRAVVAEIALPE
jgi:endonuclease/exonuclease/phosphatase family metal-dependent hydrolase